MAPVAAMISGNSSSIGPMKSKMQFIASPGPAVNPSSDIDLFTTTLPFPVLVPLTTHLRRPSLGCHPGLRMTTLRAPGSDRLLPAGDERLRPCCTAAVICESNHFQVVIDGETAAVVPRTTTSEIRRYKAS